VLAWYALYTKPHKEEQLRYFLEEQGREVYLPMIPVARPRAGRRKKKPFFPCYLFVRGERSNGDVTSLRWTPGLRRIVAYGEIPIAVPDEMIELIRVRLAEQEAVLRKPPGLRFKAGQRVRITEGPLSSMEAIFERGVSSGERVRVFVEVLGRMTACELDGSWIEA